MKKYTVYLDENFPKQLAHGLNILQQPQGAKENLDIQVLSIKDVFGQGTPDETWIPVVGSEKAVVITQDLNIQRTRHQRELYQKHGVGMFFFAIRDLPYWEIVKIVVNKWEEAKGIIKHERTPFAYRCTSKKGFEKI